MNTEKYLSYYFPFDKIDFVKKGDGIFMEYGRCADDVFFYSYR